MTRPILTPIRRLENGTWEAHCPLCFQTYNPAEPEDTHDDCPAWRLINGNWTPERPPAPSGVERNYFTTGDIRNLYLLVNHRAL
jgi:hypothetical protein